MRFCKICKVNFFSVDPRGRTIVSHRQEADKHGAQGLPKVQGQKKNEWMQSIGYTIDSCKFSVHFSACYFTRIHKVSETPLCLTVALCRNKS